MHTVQATPPARARCINNKTTLPSKFKQTFLFDDRPQKENEKKKITFTVADVCFHEDQAYGKGGMHSRPAADL